MKHKDEKTVKRAIWSPVVFLSALVMLSSTQRLSASTTRNRVRHRIIAATGEAAPAGVYGPLFINATLNARHEVAFDANATGPPPTIGVFVGDGKRTSTIALGTNPDPAEPSFGILSNPFITNDGDVVFDVNTGVFRSNRERIIPLVLIGDQVPGRGALTSLRGERLSFTDIGEHRLDMNENSVL
jgi:hypothetical protein